MPGTRQPTMPAGSDVPAGPPPRVVAGRCIWLTGRAGSGRHTIGAATAEALRAQGVPVALLDAEALDRHLARGPADGGMASLVWLVGLLVEAGVTVVVAVDTPRRAERERLRDLIAGFVEVHVDAPAAVCAARGAPRDPRYEEPLAPDLRIPTHDRDPRASAAQLISFLT